jgi:hypothetical protein
MTGAGIFATANLDRLATEFRDAHTDILDAIYLARLHWVPTPR